MIQIIYIDLPYVDSDVPSWATSYESTPLSYIEIYIMVNNEKKKIWTQCKWNGGGLRLHD